MLHLRRAQIITVFQLELQASRSSQSGDCRGDHCEYLCFLDAISHLVETFDHSRSSMLFSFPLVPVFQDNEISTCVGLFATSHNRKSADTDIVFYFRITVQNLIDFPTHSLCAFQTWSRWQLDDSYEVAVIFIRDEGWRPFHEQDNSHCRNNTIRDQRKAGTDE